MHIVAIVQARMGSTRLPGKVLMPIGEIPMLALLVHRTQQAQRLDQVIVATSIRVEDDAIAHLCAEQDIPCFRGSEDDVLERFFLAAKEVCADIVVRITGDCPLIDAGLIDQVVGKHIAQKNDFTFNDVENGYPRGTDIEVFNFDVLARVYQTTTDTSYREHVTLYVYEHQEEFRIRVLNPPPNLERINLRLCVDEVSDLKLVRHIFAHFAPGKDFSLGEVVEYLDRYPDIQKINSDIKQKSL